MQINKIALLAGLILFGKVYAGEFLLPSANEALIGKIEFVLAKTGDSVSSITQRYDIGFNALQLANPQIDFSQDFDITQPIQIADLHLLPDLPRKGIVINLPEMRLYYFSDKLEVLYSYPIGIGKIGKTIPLTNTSVIRKTTNPTWTPPKSIREFNLEQGIILPNVMPPGPDNPLGPYAIYMKLPTYLIHSTIFPESVGKRASFGCIRMYEPDVADLFTLVRLGTPVTIINQPIKAGWQKQYLYLEMHEPLSEFQSGNNSFLQDTLRVITKKTTTHLAIIDWQAITYLIQEKDGIPHEVGIALR